MSEAELAGLSARILWASFALAVVFGAIAQRTQFCTMGAVADIVNMGDWSRMRAWVLAMGVATIGFNSMVGLGWVQAGNSLYAGPRLLLLSHTLGGALFGFGMVLASGCGSKTLVRIGGGSLKGLLVFCVLALAAYATMRGLFSVWRVAVLDPVSLTLPTGQDLPSLLAHASGTGSTKSWAWALGLGLGGAMVAFAVARAEGRSFDVLLSGVGLGLVVVAVWWVSGRWGHLMEHPLTLEETFLVTNSRRMESLTFVAPIAYTVDWFILFSDKLKLLTLGIASVAGVVVGSALVALVRGSFRWEGFAGTEDTANHIVGAALMGVGGVTAMGCTIGQGMSGVSTLALGSFITLACMIGGAVLALRWQVWRVERQA
jgi:uncharacterized protein